MAPRRAWPQAMRRKRRVGVLTWWPEDDPAGRTQTAALAEGLAVLGWSEGNNIQVDYRRGSGEPGRMGVAGQGSGRAAPGCPGRCRHPGGHRIAG